MKSVIVIVGSSTRDSAQAPRLSDSDRAALGLALSNGPETVIAYYPAGDAVARQFALAAGVSDVRTLSDAKLPEFDLALVGLGALDRCGAVLAGTIAESRSATLLFDVLDLQIEPAGIVALKDAGRGCREEWTVTGAVVAVVSPAARRPPYVSRHKRRTAALLCEGTKRVGLSRDATSDGEWQAVRPRVRIGPQGAAFSGGAEDRMSSAFGMTAGTAPGGRERVIVADPATCARHLARYLAHHGFLPEQSADFSDIPPPTQPPPAALPPASSVSASGFVAELPRPMLSSPRSDGERSTRLMRRPRAAGESSILNAHTLPIRDRRPRPLIAAAANLRRHPRRLE